MWGEAAYRANVAQAQPDRAPEAVGHCTAQKRCAPLTAKTHVFDFANRGWILGAAGNLCLEPSTRVEGPAQAADAVERGAEADALASVMTAMSAPEPDARPSFSGALALLDGCLAGARGCRTGCSRRHATALALNLPKNQSGVGPDGTVAWWSCTSDKIS